MHIRRIGEPKTTAAPTVVPIDFEAAMETDEELVCGVEDPEQCDSCT